MKKLIQWLAKVFDANIEKEVVKVKTETVVEKVTEVKYLGGTVHGDVTVEGDLIIIGDLRVSGCITIKKED